AACLAAPDGLARRARRSVDPRAHALTRAAPRARPRTRLRCGIRGPAGRRPRRYAEGSDPSPRTTKRARRSSLWVTADPPPSGGVGVARSWDEVAPTLVVERGDALSRYAYLLTGSVDDAADLVQDALVRTFGTPRFGLTLPRAEAYVRRAILNQVIDRSPRAA